MTSLGIRITRTFPVIARRMRLASNGSCSAQLQPMSDEEYAIFIVEIHDKKKKLANTR